MMSANHLREQNSRWIYRAAGLVITVAAPGCGSNAAEPGFPDVSGVYADVVTNTAVTCIPALFTREASAVQAVVRVEQQGAQITLRLLEVDGQEVEEKAPSGPITVERDGRFSAEPPPTPWEAVMTPQGDSLFTQTRASGSGRFLLTEQPITMIAQATVTEEYRDGSPTGPLVTTCTFQQIEHAIRTGA